MKSFKLPAAACLLFCGLWGAAQTDSVSTFSYKKDQTLTVPYNKSVTVIITDVNTLDYKYDVTIEAIAPRPVVPGTGLPGLPGTPKAKEGGTECKIDEANTKLSERTGRFGDGLETWLTEFQSKACEAIGKKVLEKIAASGIKDNGRLELDSGELVKQLSKTTAGGALKITVKVKERNKSIIEQVGANPTQNANQNSETDDHSSTGNTATSIGGEEPVSTEQLPTSDYQLKTVAQSPAEIKNADHPDQLTFTLEFEKPSGIDFSFGPYISFMGQKSYTRYKKPGSDNLVLGLEKDDKIRYGVAAYWHVAVNKNEKLEASWGVAYTTAGDLDSQIEGLLGLSYRPMKSRLHVNFGASVGNKTKLAEGYELNVTVIDADAEIPVTTQLGVSGYLGLSFSF